MKVEMVQQKEEVHEKDYKSGPTQYIDSREVAEIVGKEHKNIVRDIKRYSSELRELNFELSEFFVESSYRVEGQSRTYPCYLVTKKGCEFIAHKLTGIKGTKFTATYINRFHEMEDVINGQRTDVVSEDMKQMLKQFIQQQTEFNQLIMEKLEKANPFSSFSDKKINPTNPYNSDVVCYEERMRHLNDLIDQVSELYNINRNRLLHHMYITLEEELNISLKSYLDVIKAETNDENICIMHVIVRIDRFYEMAVEINEYAIKCQEIYS